MYVCMYVYNVMYDTVDVCMYVYILCIGNIDTCMYVCMYVKVL